MLVSVAKGQRLGFSIVECVTPKYSRLLKLDRIRAEVILAAKVMAHLSSDLIVYQQPTPALPAI